VTNFFLIFYENWLDLEFIGAIDSTYKLLNISKTRNLIFEIFTGFFALIYCR